MQPNVAIIIPAGPGDSAWRNLLPQLDAANAQEIRLVLTEDQGLLMPRRVFAALGGFDESIGKGEDHALIWAAHAQGIPLHSLNATIRTSARRYAEHGWWRTTWQHLRLTRTQAAKFSRHARAHAAIERA